MDKCLNFRKKESDSMAKSKTKKAYYNMLASGTFEVITLICGLILPRFILGAFGSANNGLVSSISQFLSYISLLTLGIAGPTRVALYKSLSKNDMRETSAILKANQRFYRKIAVAFVVYMYILAAVFPFIVKSNLKWIEISLLVIVIGIGSLAEYCFGVTYASLLDADQSAYIYTIIKIVCKILNTITAVVLICAGSSLLVVKFGSAIFYVLQPLTLTAIVRKKYDLPKSVKADNRVIKQRGDAAASSIANIIHDKTDIVVLTLFASTLAVSVYSVYMLVMNGLVSIMRVFTSTLEAPFGILWAKGDIDSLRRNMRTYEFLVYSFTAIVFSCTGILVMPFVSLYTDVVSDTNYIVPAFAVLSTIATAVFCIRQPYLTMVQAAGKYKEMKIGNFIEAGLNIGLSLALVYKFGLVGVTIGTLAANLFRTVLYAAYMSKCLIQRSYLTVILRTVWLICNCAIIVGIYFVFPGMVSYSTWSEWIISGGKCVALSMVVTLGMAFVFYRSDLIQAIKVIKRMIFK